MNTAPVIEQHEDLDIVPLENYEVTNMCQCYECPNCSVMSFGDLYDETCEHCDTDEKLVKTDYCHDACTLSFDDLRFTLKKWVENNSSDYGFMIFGERMTWMNLNGFKIVGVDGEEFDLIKELSVNSEWTQRWTVDPHEGGKAVCVLSHHDSPCGETYTIMPRIGCACEDDRFSDWDY